MCIALLSTAHPQYSLILINNRDEYLNRPTAVADWWAPPDQHILGGRDLLRQIQGTWLGITKHGRVAVLTNFREDTEKAQGAQSRGAMVNAFLQNSTDSAGSTEAFVNDLVNGKGLTGVGGFSLVCGTIGQPLAVISNRTLSADAVTWILQQKGETVGLSNATFADRTWPKVLKGEKLMNAVVQECVAGRNTERELIENLFRVLSTDTLPKRERDQAWASYVKDLRNSIMIPPIGGDNMDDISADDIAAARSAKALQTRSWAHPEKHQAGMGGLYGTQKQTVVLVSQDGHVTFVERTLYDASARWLDETEQDRWLEFDIEEAP